MFPDAKFIYLMRNPYTVFESTRNFFTNTIQPLKLQDISEKEIVDNIIKVYTDLYFRYQEDKKLIPEGNLIEIKFEDFEQNSLEMTHFLYRDLKKPVPKSKLISTGKRVTKKKNITMTRKQCISSRKIGISH